MICTSSGYYMYLHTMYVYVVEVIWGCSVVRALRYGNTVGLRHQLRQHPLRYDKGIYYDKRGDIQGFKKRHVPVHNGVKKIIIFSIDSFSSSFRGEGIRSPTCYSTL